MPLRVLIADDHEPFVCSLEQLLAHDASVQVVGVAHDGVEAVRLAASLDPDLVLLDVDMPRLDGLQAAEQIKERRPATRIVIVTGTAGSGAQAGSVERLVLKSHVGEELLPAIRAGTPA